MFLDINNVFFDSIEELIMYLVALVVFALIFFLGKKKVNFSIRILVAMALGLIIGLVVPEYAKYLRVFGQVYTRLIKLIVVPLVFFSVIRSFTNFDNVNSLKKIGIKTLMWLMILTLIGSIFGMVAGSVFNLGSGLEIPNDVNPNEPFKLVDALLNLVPTNIITHAANNDVLQIIFFAILIAFAMIIEGKKHPERVEPFKNFVTSFAEVMNRVTKIIIRFTPYGVFGLVAYAVARNNVETLKQLGIYILVIYVTMFIFFTIIQMGFIATFGQLNPVQYVKKISPALVVAFTTQSSLGTLPVTIKSLKRAGVDEKIANFATPLGATMGMAACAGIFPAIVAVMTANAMNVNLSLTSYIIIAISSVIASIGIAGVPGIASVAATVVLASVGLPLEGLLLVLAVDPLVDMGRTLVNVTGSSVAATLTAKSEKAINMDVFNSNLSVEQEILE